MDYEVDFDDANFSRAAESDAFGKLIANLPMLRIDVPTAERVSQMASAAGMNASEYQRTVIRLHVWGVDHCQNVANNRLQRVIGNAVPMHCKADGEVAA